MRNKPRLLTPGPTPLPEEVRLALAKDVVHHRKPAFKKTLGEVQVGLKALFGTRQTVAVMASSGTGSMCAAVDSLFTPGQKVLVVEAGKFAQRWIEIARSRGLEIIAVEFPWGAVADLEAVRAALDGHPDAAGLLVQASETSTGVLHPVREMGAMTRDRDTLLVVDGISAVGVSPCPMDEWSVDCLLTGSQKGLMLPTGLSFAALSPRARKRAENAGAPHYYFNLAAELARMDGNQTLFSSAVGLVEGLRAGLARFMEHGFDEIYRKQWALTMLARTGVVAMGLELLAKESFTWGLTSVLMPSDVDATKVIAAAEKKYGVILAGGQDHLKGRLVRLGHMGHVDWADVAAGLHALARVLADAGHAPDQPDYLERALRAYETALETYPSGTLQGGRA